MSGQARRYIAAVRKRDEFFGDRLVGDPAWNLLVDLWAASAEGRDVSVSSACIASRSPQTTALRIIARLEQAGFVVRAPDEDDRRRSFLRLTEAGEAGCKAFLDEIGAGEGPCGCDAAARLEAIRGLAS